MKFRSLFCTVAFALPLGLQGAEEAATPTPKPGLVHRLMHPFEGIGVKKGEKPKDPTVTFRNLEMGMLVDPDPVKVPDIRLLKVTLTLTNRAKKMVQLDFPTSQRVEVLLKTKEGKTIEQWSQDQAFTNEPTLVTINPNERLEYTVNVSTRDMAAGQSYTVEGFFPNFEQLKKLHPILAK